MYLNGESHLQGKGARGGYSNTRKHPPHEAHSLHRVHRTSTALCVLCGGVGGGGRQGRRGCRQARQSGPPGKLNAALLCIGQVVGFTDMCGEQKGSKLDTQASPCRLDVQVPTKRALQDRCPSRSAGPTQAAALLPAPAANKGVGASPCDVMSCRVQKRL